MCDVLFRGGGKKTIYVFFPPKKPKMFAGREVVSARRTTARQAFWAFFAGSLLLNVSNGEEECA